MRFKTVNSWLDWQQTLNPKNIDLGLNRVERVYHHLNLPRVGKSIITVAGTNGKGSTVACYETWLKNSGRSVASYTSPHLLRYNERIKLNLEPVSDQMLIEAFDRVDQARGKTELTYFEFGTLAALVLISRFQPDVAILEVGLGGRLDAVNIIDADLAHITSIGLDHEDWLGNTREQIAAEKAGILRERGLAVCNDRDLPSSVLSRLLALNCQYQLYNCDYGFINEDNGQITWRSKERHLKFLPPLEGSHQAENISGVLAGLELLGFLQGYSDQSIAEFFQKVDCPGRLQSIHSRLPTNLIVDVGHNEDAANVLFHYLSGIQSHARVVVLLGMLADKNHQAFVKRMASVVDEWWLLDLTGDRGLSADNLAEKISSQVIVEKKFNSADSALEYALLSLDNQDILLATGSFMTVEAVLNCAFLYH